MIFEEDAQEYRNTKPGHHSDKVLWNHISYIFSTGVKLKMKSLQCQETAWRQNWQGSSLVVLLLALQWLLTYFGSSILVITPNLFRERNSVNEKIIYRIFSRVRSTAKIFLCKVVYTDVRTTFLTTTTKRFMLLLNKLVFIGWYFYADRNIRLVLL